MQNRTLSLSLIISAALTIPSLAMAATADDSNMMDTDITTAVADNNLQNAVEQDDSELLVDQANDTDLAEADPNLMQDPSLIEDAVMIEDPSLMQAPKTAQILPPTSNQQGSSADKQPSLATEANSSAQDSSTTPITLQETRKFTVR